MFNNFSNEGGLMFSRVLSVFGLLCGMNSANSFESDELNFNGGTFNTYAFRVFGGVGASLVGLDLNNPSSTTDIRNAGSLGRAYNADFIGDDFSTLYVIKATVNELVEVNTATGAETLVGTLPAIDPSDLWRGLSWDPTTNQLYAVTLNDLYIIDPVDASTTFVGRTVNVLFSGLAANLNGDLYTVDIQRNNLIQIDPITGIGTPISVGPVNGLGMNGQGIQALDFDYGTGVLYWSGCAPGCGGIRTINTSTGVATSYGAVGSGSPQPQYGGFAIARKEDLIFVYGFEL